MMKKLLSVAVAMSVVIVGALPAFAEDEPVPVYDETEHILTFAVDGECMIDTDMDIVYTVAEDGSITFEVVVADEDPLEEPGEPIDDPEAVDPLEGCFPFSVEGPNGQVNHGTFVSNLMHALKEMGIKGSDKKAFKAALTDYGKGEQQVKANEGDSTVGDDEVSLEPSEDTFKPAKPLKADKSNNSNRSNRGNSGK